VVLRGGSDGRTTLTFDRDVYTATVREDAAVGDAVVRVTAFLVDAGTMTTTTTSAAAVVFAIIGGNVGAAFTIDSRTGVIRVARRLHHTVLSQYNLTVSAAVSSTHPLTGIRLHGVYRILA